jgi:hypothetical protein
LPRSDPWVDEPLVDGRLAGGPLAKPLEPEDRLEPEEGLVRVGFFAVVFAVAPFAVVFAVAPAARLGRLVPLDPAAARVCPLAEREEACDDAPDVFLALLLGA